MEKCRLEKCHGANFKQSWIKKNSTKKNENAKMIHLIERKFPGGGFSTMFNFVFFSRGSQDRASNRLLLGCSATQPLHNQ